MLLRCNLTELALAYSPAGWTHRQDTSQFFSLCLAPPASLPGDTFALGSSGFNGFLQALPFLPAIKPWLSMKAIQISELRAPYLPLQTHHHAAKSAQHWAMCEAPCIIITSFYYYLQGAYYVQAMCKCSLGIAALNTHTALAEGTIFLPTLSLTKQIPVIAFSQVT